MVFKPVELAGCLSSVEREVYSLVENTIDHDIIPKIL